MNFVDPAFGVSKIRIRNIGAIDDLSLELKEKSFLAICAGNGVGKTTILEAISLIGHLPCFPTLSRQALLIEPSLIEKAWGQLRADDQYSGRIDMNALESSGVDGLIDKKFEFGSNHNFGVIDYCLFDTQTENLRTFEFSLLVHSPAYASPGRPRLTEILSRGDPDTATPQGCSSFCDDRFLSSCGLVIFDEDLQGGNFQTLIDQLAKGRTFHRGDVDGLHEEAAEIHPDRPIAEQRACAVSYVNTDLNDFGRGNDLRESPKDLTRSFGSEMIARLRIEFAGAGGEENFLHFVELKERSERILEEPPYAFSSSFVVPNTFRLTSLRLTNTNFGDPSKIGAKFGIERGHGGKRYEASFLSAGENEVLFVLKMAINLAKNSRLGNGILLLDEPDLHIASYCRKKFFKELLGICRTNGVQLIMSTHSAAFVDTLAEFGIKKEQSVQVIFKSAESQIKERGVGKINKSSIPITSEYDPVFLEYMRTQGESENKISYIIFLFKRIWSVWKSAIAEVFRYGLSDHQKAQQLSAWFITAFTLGLFFLSLGLFFAAGNDLTTLGLSDSVATILHPITGVGSLVSALTVLGQITYIVVRLRKIRADKEKLHNSLLD